MRREPNVPANWNGTYCPNFTDWKLGDIVLIAGYGSAGILIQNAQLASRNPLMNKGARWTHAAIYVGDGMVVDAAMSAGVMERSLWEYCEHRAITVRRLDDPSIPQAEIADIAARAKKHINKPYSAWQALIAALGWPPARVPNANSLYCSTFAGLVVAQATTVRLWNDPAHQPFFPAIIAQHPELKPVTLEWRNI